MTELGLSLTCRSNVFGVVVICVKGPAVRARALNGMAALLGTNANMLLRRPLSKLVFVAAQTQRQPSSFTATPGGPSSGLRLGGESQIAESQYTTTGSPKSGAMSPLLSPEHAGSAAGKLDILALLRRRAFDEKPNVRKAALQVRPPFSRCFVAADVGVRLRSLAVILFSMLLACASVVGA